MFGLEKGAEGFTVGRGTAELTYGLSVKLKKNGCGDKNGLGLYCS